MGGLAHAVRDAQHASRVTWDTAAVARQGASSLLGLVALGDEHGLGIDRLTVGSVPLVWRLDVGAVGDLAPLVRRGADDGGPWQTTREDVQSLTWSYGRQRTRVE